MNVSLTPELEKLVAEKVDGGRYASASEVVREALRLLDERDLERAAKLGALRAKVAVGTADLEAGRHSQPTVEDIKREARRRHGL